MEFIGNEPARNYIRSLPKRDKQIWSNLYPKANPVALDLLSKMLAFNPNKRITVEECLAHPYFKGLHSATEEPLADRKFDWAFDNFEPTKELLQNMVYDLSLHFHPENTHKLHPILQKNTHI